MHFFSVFTLMTLTHVLIIIGVSIRVIKVLRWRHLWPGCCCVLLASGGRNCLILHVIIDQCKLRLRSWYERRHSYVLQNHTVTTQMNTHYQTDESYLE